MTSGGRAADWKTGSFGPYGCPENLSVRFFPNSAGSPAREFEEFEVGRRYSNPAYQATLTNKNTEDLMREQINIANLNNWLVLKTKQQLEKQNVLLGQILANDAYQTYKPMLAAQLESVNAGVSRK
ncbi:conjugal transfer protein TraW [Klebsiella pneumoniae]|uniref:conjugal transfer protein TraW n=1 Tax=Klebsiella pneumoniae TaxID=573 RepID=UPI00372CEB44